MSVLLKSMSASRPSWAVPGLMSLTICVPELVPSLFQSSEPLAEVNALKKSRPWETVRPLIAEMVATIDAPAEELSLRQRLPVPEVGTALKKSEPLYATGLEMVVIGGRSVI